MDMHAEYGGVVPELASRDHCLKIVDVLEDALGNLSLDSIDQIAYTSGPGLLGALLIGESFAQGLSTALNIPLIPINHLEGHLMSPMMEFPEIKMPFICLLVSGGHSMIIKVKNLGDYELLGDTRDDAVGEAFDKVARMLDLGYPGGPAVDRLARTGDPHAVQLPRPQPMMRPPKTPSGHQGTRALDMSFSGLKTAVRAQLGQASSADLCASFQQAVVDVLTNRVRRAAAETGVHSVTMAGGVAANSQLREAMMAMELDVSLPPKNRCTDNAAMIAHAGRLRLVAGERHGLDRVARAQWTPGA